MTPAERKEFDALKAQVSTLAAKVSGFDPRKLQGAPDGSVGAEAGARTA